MGENKAVVVADPDAEHRRRIVGIVERAGEQAELELTVHEAADGSTAEELIEEVDPALVVTEVLLDGQSGLQLLRKARSVEERQDLRWVFVSSLNREVDRYWALRNGADAYVMRPYEDDALLARLVKLLRGEAERERPR
jgi:twitching motility two-component system response regulator PilH